MLPGVSKILYPLVVQDATYYDKAGNRKFLTGGTPALETAQNAYKKFVENYEKGDVSMMDVDGVIWAVHNNGPMAQRYIRDCKDEADAMQFLDELSGIIRSK